MKGVTVHNLRICKECKWVAFAVSRKYAEKEVKQFNKYYDSLTKEQQESYYGSKKSSIRQYERCFFCGGCFHNFRQYSIRRDKDISGRTLQPIIWEKLK